MKNGVPLPVAGEGAADGFSLPTDAFDVHQFRPPPHLITRFSAFFHSATGIIATFFGASGTWTTRISIADRADWLRGLRNCRPKTPASLSSCPTTSSTTDFAFVSMVTTWKTRPTGAVRPSRQLTKSKSSITWKTIPCASPSPSLWSEVDRCRGVVHSQITCADFESSKKSLDLLDFFRFFRFFGFFPIFQIFRFFRIFRIFRFFRIFSDFSNFFGIFRFFRFFGFF